MWIVIAIVIAVALTAAVMDLAVFPALQPPAGSADFRVHLRTFDVGYDQPNYQPEWQVKAGQVVVVDGTELAGRKAERVLTNDPVMGIFRHVDAGYEAAEQVAAERDVRIPMTEA